MQRRFDDPHVAAAFAALAAPLQPPLLALRALIYDVAGDLPLSETLKWGEPAYRPRAPRTGTTIRINALRGSTTHYALFVPCQTNLIEIYRDLYADHLSFEGKRAIILSVADALPEAMMRHCIALALSYHSNRRSLV